MQRPTKKQKNQKQKHKNKDKPSHYNTKPLTTETRIQIGITLSSKTHTRLLIRAIEVINECQSKEYGGGIMK